MVWYCFIEKNKIYKHENSYTLIAAVWIECAQ